jgi:hypothetical protein
MSMNPGMTPDAVRVVCFFVISGEGEHAYDRDTLACLLEEGGDRRIAKALGRAEKCGYLMRHKGGRGSDRFSVIAARFSRREVVSPPDSAGEKSPVVVVVVDDVDIPPKPPVRDLAPKAAATIERYGELLSGCRGAIRDYLIDVVPLEKQSAWVDDIASKINGLGFNWLGVPMAARSGLVAAAVNELRASGEQGMKRRPGDPLNVRTKLNVLVQNHVSPMTYAPPSRPKPGTEAAAVRTEYPRQNHTATTSGPTLVGGSKPPEKPADDLETLRVKRWEAENPELAGQLKTSIGIRIGRDFPAGVIANTMAQSEFRKAVLERLKGAA